MALLSGRDSKAEAPKAEAPKAEAPKAEAPKAEAPKAEAPKAEAEGLDVKFIGTAFMLTPELASQSAPVRARSDKQREMDKKVSELHALSTTAKKDGKAIATWDDMVRAKIVVTYFVEPDKAAELHKLISRSVAFLGLRARMGTAFKATEKLVKTYSLPEHYVGREVVSFAVLDKRPRGTSDGKKAAEVVKK